ncbi:MAG TPA: acyl-CoA dehydrogenase family protein [Thermoplasmata archaeon]|nr:acyl-CoA dehydrogenase family protein [Thermoplasmata archaeon]
MEFAPDRRHEEVRREVRRFVEAEVAPHADAWDRNREFPTRAWKALAAHGLAGLPFPEKFGGAGRDILSYVIAVEEISRASAALGVTLAVHVSLASQPIFNFGTDAQKRRFLRPLAQGKVLGSFCLTEPGAGSDVAAMESKAVRQGEEFVLTGRKYFIMNAPVAGTFVVFAMTDKSLAHRGISAFLVPRKSPGVRIGKIFDKMGIRSSVTSEVVFDEVRVPQENLLGRLGDGFRIAMETLDCGRISIAAQAVGIAQASLDAAVQYARHRVQFGKPIADLEAIRWMIADMATEIEAARLLTYRAAWLTDHHKKHTMEASMAKLFAASAAVEATRKALQIHGGYGYMTDLPLERYYRDAKITEIYEGTSVIQRLVISNELL